MPRIFTTRMDFRYLPHADLMVFGLGVCHHMTGNADFPSPPIPIADVEAAFQAFKEAISMTGDKGAGAVLKRSRRSVLNALQLLARYVNHVGYNDAAKILGGGFRASSGNKLATPIPDRPFVESFSVDNMRGCITIKVSGDKAARSYTAIVAAVSDEAPLHKDGRTISRPAGIAAVCSSTQRKMRITGLSSGLRYRVQVAAVGTAGLSGLSDPVEFVAQ